MIEQTNQQRYARERREQTDRRREEILDASQTLILEKGLENVSMKEIAEKAHISKMTLYRYFPSRDPIAFEIAIRMLREIYSSIGICESDITEPCNIIHCHIKAIEKFHEHEHAYCYLGMFDHLYAQSYPSEELAQWYKMNINQLDGAFKTIGSDDLAFYTMIGNSTMSFLSKLAARGKLLEKEQGISVDDQLDAFKDVLELLIQSKRSGKLLVNGRID